MYRFNGFTQKANHAMNLAIQCAEEMGHTYVGSEHILLGLLKEGSGVAAAVLRAVEVDASQLELLMTQKIGLGSGVRWAPRILPHEPSGFCRSP